MISKITFLIWTSQSHLSLIEFIFLVKLWHLKQCEHAVIAFGNNVNWSIVKLGHPAKLMTIPKLRHLSIKWPHVGTHIGQMTKNWDSSIFIAVVWLIKKFRQWYSGISNDKTRVNPVVVGSLTNETTSI